MRKSPLTWFSEPKLFESKLIVIEYNISDMKRKEYAWEKLISSLQLRQ